jgi:hypothetical protein
MTFPTIPTTGAGRILSNVQANTTATRTFPSLSSLTKNSGDLLIAICISYQTSTGTNAAFSGWTGGFTELPVGGDTATSTTMAIGIAYKFSTGSETGTFAVTQAATITGSATMFLLSIPGAHASTAPEAGGRTSGTAGTSNPTSFDPGAWAAEDTLWISVGAQGETSTAGTFDTMLGAPTNYTGAVIGSISNDAVGGVQGAIAFRQLNASSEDAAGFTKDTTNTRDAAIIIAVRPLVPQTLRSGEVTGTLSKVGEVTGDNGSVTLPARIGTATNAVEPESHSYVPVIMDTNGMRYRVIEGSLNNNPAGQQNQPRMMKSSDGETWTEMDAANRPGVSEAGIGDLESGWLTYDAGGYATFSWQRSYPVWVRFRTSDHATNPDTWLITTRNQVGTGTGSPQYMSHTKPADQSYHWAFFNDGSDMAYLSVNSTTGVEASQNVLDTAAIGPAAIINPDDNSSIVIYAKSSQLHYKRLTSAGTLTGPTRIDTSGVNAVALPHAAPQVYDNGTNEYVGALWANGTGLPRFSLITNGTPGSEEVVGSSAVVLDPGATGNQGAVLSLAVNPSNGTFYAIWSQASNSDVMYSERPLAGSWSTPVAISQPAFTPAWVYASVLTKPDTSLLFAWVYVQEVDDDQSAVWYNETALAALGQGEVTGTLTRVGSVTGNRRNVSNWTSVVSATTTSGIQQGSVSGTLSRVGSVTGKKFPAGAVTGALSKVGSVTGKRFPAGAITGAISRVGSVTGKRVAGGAVTGALSKVGSITGTRVSRGAVTGALSRVGSITGTTVRRGAVSGTLSRVGSVTGARASAGSVAGALSRVGSMVGETPAVGAQDGSVSGTLTRVGSVTGKRFPAGAVTGAISRAGVVMGLELGYVIGAITRAGTVTGVRTPKGAVAGTVTRVGAVTGRRVAGGAVTGALSKVGSVTGQAPLVGVNDGSVIGTVTRTGVVTGTRVPKAAVTGTLTRVGSVTGSAPKKGAITGTLTRVGSVTGKRIAGGSITGALTRSGAVTGKEPAGGSVTGALIRIGGVTGVRVAKGAVTGTVLRVGSVVGRHPPPKGAVVGAITRVGAVTGESPEVIVTLVDGRASIRTTAVSAVIRPDTDDTSSVPALAGAIIEA